MLAAGFANEGSETGTTVHTNHREPMEPSRISRNKSFGRWKHVCLVV